MMKVNLIGEAPPVAGSVAALNPATRQALAFCISAGVVLAIAGIFYFSWGRDIQRQQTVLHQEQAVAKTLAAVQSQNKSYERELNDLQNRAGVVQKLEKSRNGPVELMAGLGDVVNQTKDLYLLRVSPAGATLHIQGQARTVGSIAAFINALKNSISFSDVQLKRYYQDDQHGRTSFRFNLDCVYMRSQAEGAGAASPRKGGS